MIKRITIEILAKTKYLNINIECFNLIISRDIPWLYDMYASGCVECALKGRLDVQEEVYGYCRTKTIKLY